MKNLPTEIDLLIICVYNYNNLPQIEKGMDE